MINSHINIRVQRPAKKGAIPEVVTLPVKVTYETDEEAEPEDRIICAVEALCIIVTAPNIKLAGARMEMEARKQIAVMKGGGLFGKWVNDQIKAS